MQALQERTHQTSQTKAAIAKRLQRCAISACKVAHLVCTPAPWQLTVSIDPLKLTRIKDPRLVSQAIKCCFSEHQSATVTTHSRCLMASRSGGGGAQGDGDAQQLGGATAAAGLAAQLSAAAPVRSRVGGAIDGIAGPGKGSHRRCGPDQGVPLVPASCYAFRSASRSAGDLPHAYETGHRAVVRKHLGEWGSASGRAWNTSLRSDGVTCTSVSSPDATRRNIGSHQVQS